LIAAVLFGLAYDGGAYDVLPRHALAIAVWWAIALLLITGLAPAEPLGRRASTGGALLVLFTVWTGLSMAWAESTERAVLEDYREAVENGVEAVPALVIGEEWLVCGAREANDYLAILRRFIETRSGLGGETVVH